ncbi:hypothetical protein [Halapricum salinum]|uniref:DUF7981 domain-containing protein n=1 Tax=Halapricum salinum TaxID=1457250 RepID=A0A4D6HCB7_9EURY|nr:hypothetical protein [Halapricum salinum]QCC50798.1 hypothetical protein DV733_05855 [Halapricum salinum]
MTPDRKRALLWGVIGALAFLVLLQGYELLADRRVDWLVKFGVALVVGVLATGTTRLLQGRVPTQS